MKADITSLLQLDGEGRQLGQATDALPAADPDVAAQPHDLPHEFFISQYLVPSLAVPYPTAVMAWLRTVSQSPSSTPPSCRT
jgi:hypothetical protein